MIGFLLSWAFQIFLWVLFARFFVDLARSINPGWRPRGLILVVSEILLTITDPPLNFLRRFVKPVRIGPIGFDLAWTILLIAVIILRNSAQLLPF